MTKYKITLHNLYDVKIPFNSKQHNSLLDALEQNKISIEFQCRKGFCGACRLRIYKGKVVYRSKPIAFINKNEILACSCQLISDIDILVSIK